MEGFSLDQIFWEFLDRCKPLFFPEQWNQMFLDFTKNELFVLLFLYRKSEVTMTEISSYIGVPLNTVTGVVNRLEKKELLTRERLKDDRRVVIVRMTESGKTQVKQHLEELEKYFQVVTSKLTEAEIQTSISLVTKIFDIFSEEARKKEEGTKKQIKRILIE